MNAVVGDGIQEVTVFKIAAIRCCIVSGSLVLKGVMKIIRISKVKIDPKN